jgi:hypothetical protein
MKLGRFSFCILVYCITGVYGIKNCYSQNISNTVIKGTAIDANTRQPLPFVSVTLENTSTATATDLKGNYNIVTIATSYRVKFSFIGYETEMRVVYPGKTQVINIEMRPSSVELGEVVVKPTKRTYRNKDNPAVDLIGKVIEKKDLNRIENLDFFKYNKYEKTVFSLSNLPDNFRQPKAFSKFHFLLDNVDTTRQDGKKNIPLYIKEILSDNFFRKNPKAHKEIVKAEKTISLDEYIDNKGLSASLQYLYQDIDIYSNEIFFLTNKFLSPVASTAPLLYRYYILDTSMVDNVNCIKMFFEPRNPSDFMFHGFLFITSDSSYAIKKIDMSFNKKINIDWINDVRIVQDFEKVQDKAWLLTKDIVSVDFGLSQNMPGLYGQKEVFRNNYSINEPVADTVFKGVEKTTKLDEYQNLDRYWESARLSPITDSEKELYLIVDSVRKIPAFRHEMDLVMLLGYQYLNLRKFEIGPVGTFYSFNHIEGSRLRFGGRTKPEFNKWVYFNSYLAYAFNDNLFKYNIGLTYSLSGQSIYKFPVKSIALNYQYDTETPGQVLQYSTQDNFLLSFKRGVDDKMFYNRILKLEYLNESENHFSYTLGFLNKRQSPAGNLHFTADVSLPTINDIPYIKISEAYLRLRYAPREEFYQGKVYRSPLPSKYPVIQIESSFSSKNLSSDYNYQRIKFEISRRFYLSIVGYTDVAAEAGRIFGKVPFPLLFIHNANQTYSYQYNSYNMMNFLEFAGDRYFSLNIDHSFNGFFFNKVPLLKKLKFREVATFKLLYGGLGSRNNPHLNSDLFMFPTGPDGNPVTFSLDKKPYIEGSVGISNILRILRIDLIKRFSYLDNPNVKGIGLRLQLKLDI